MKTGISFTFPVYVGADVTHPSAGDKSSPSIAAVVASKDSYPTLYNAEVRIQRKEIILDLKEMVKTLLKKFHASTRVKPDKIIFYRDGVGEGQFREVLAYELSAIQKACLELQADYTPAITFIVVQKRHRARFFAVDRKDQKGKSMNIPAGTVVDFLIVTFTFSSRLKFELLFWFAQFDTLLCFRTKCRLKKLTDKLR